MSNSTQFNFFHFLQDFITFNVIIFTSLKYHTSPLRKMQDLKQESHFWTKKVKSTGTEITPSGSKRKACIRRIRLQHKHCDFLEDLWVKKKRPWASLPKSVGWAQGEKLISLMLWANRSCRVAFCHRQVVLKACVGFGPLGIMGNG